MNRAATQDLRAVAVCRRSRPCSATARHRAPATQQMLDLLLAAGGRRAAAGSTGTSTARSTIPARRSWMPLAAVARRGHAPGPRAAHAELATLSALDDRRTARARLRQRLVRLRRQGPAHAARRKRHRPFASYCGDGDLAACRASLWAAIQQAGNSLQPRRVPTRPHGAPTRPPSGSRSRRAADARRCAGRTGRRSSR